MMKSVLTLSRVKGAAMVALAAVVALSPMLGTARVTRAAEARVAPDAAGVVTINGGGGVAADGSDGIAMVFNMNTAGGSDVDAGDNVIYKNENYTYGPGDTGVHLNIGGQLYSTLNGSSASSCLLTPSTGSDANGDPCVDTTSADTLPFDALAITVSGSAKSDGSMTSTGNGSATLTYTVDVGGKTYTLKRIITYTAGAKFYKEQLQVIMPAGTTAPVKLYKGGDLAPGGFDEALSIYMTAPGNNIQEIETSSQLLYGMKELPAETNPTYFTGAVADTYFDVYDELTTGAAIDFHDNQDPLYHDAGAMIYYDLGTIPGTYNKYNITYVGDQAVNLEASWSSATIASEGELSITLTNSLTSTATGLGYTFTAPAGTKIGAVTTDCDDTAGTVTVNTTAGTVVLDGAELAALSSCVLTVEIIKTGTVGSVSIGEANFTGIEGTDMNVAVETSSANFTSLAPTFTRTKSPTITPGGPTLTPVPPTNTRTATNVPAATNTKAPATATSAPAVTNTSAPAATSTPVPPTRTSTRTKTNTPSKTPTMTPTPIEYMMKKGAIGASFVLGLLQNGTLASWGMNREYQANVPPCCGSMIDDVAVGTNFAIALKGGRVYGWGANTLKQIDIPTTAQKDITAIAAGGSFGLALNKKGGVVFWGNSKSPAKKMPKSITKKGVKLIAAGNEHALAVTTKNKVIGWGANKSGQTKAPAKALKKKVITQVAAGIDHSLALLSDGTVVAWGGNTAGQIKVPATAVDIKFVSAGNKFSMALTNAGKVIGWGDNSYKQLEVPAEYTDIYTIAAGYANSALGLRNGRIIVLGDPANDVMISRTPTKTATPTP